MKRLIALLLVILCVGAAGCAAEQPPAPTLAPTQAPAPTPKASPKPSPDAVTDAVTDAEPVDNAPDPFFYQPPEEAPREVAIHIYKSRRTLELIMDGEAAGRFPIGLGFAPEGDKEKQGDGKTPVGEYYVCSRNDRSHYYLSLGVSYPNTEDARRGLDTGLIDQETYDRIADAEARRALPDWDTPLGGEICIHSGGSRTDWTWGCIGTEDETMDILWEYCPHGTPIWIYE